MPSYGQTPTLLAAVALMRVRETLGYGAVLVTVLGFQIVLGIANVATGLPLSVAVAHNAVAALLLVQVVVINFVLSRAPSPS